jgi:hypothetical protein
MSSVGSRLTNSTPCSMEIAIGRKTTKPIAKAAQSEPAPRRQYTTRSSQHRDHSKEQPGVRKRAKARPGITKASSIKPLLRRSKRLKS